MKACMHAHIYTCRHAWDVQLALTFASALPRTRSVGNP